MNEECEGCKRYGSGACYALAVETTCCNQPNGPINSVVTVSNSSVDEQNGLDSTS
jgi:hypothetical protein